MVVHGLLLSAIYRGLLPVVVIDAFVRSWSSALPSLSSLYTSSYFSVQVVFAVVLGGVGVGPFRFTAVRLTEACTNVDARVNKSTNDGLVVSNRPKSSQDLASDEDFSGPEATLTFSMSRFTHVRLPLFISRLKNPGYH